MGYNIFGDDVDDGNSLALLNMVRTFQYGADQRDRISGIFSITSMLLAAFSFLFGLIFGLNVYVEYTLLVSTSIIAFKFLIFDLILMGKYVAFLIKVILVLITFFFFPTLYFEYIKNYLNINVEFTTSMIGMFGINIIALFLWNLKFLI